MEVNRAFMKLQALLKCRRCNRFLAVHHSGMVITQGPLQPAKHSLKIATSKDMDDFVQAAMEAPTAAEASAALKLAKPTRNNLKSLQNNGSRPWNQSRGKEAENMIAAAMLDVDKVALADEAKTRPQPPCIAVCIFIPIIYLYDNNLNFLQ